MKAVIWADTVQLVIMLAGQIAIVTQGTINVGGISEVFRIASDGGRINFIQYVTPIKYSMRNPICWYLFAQCTPRKHTT